MSLRFAIESLPQAMREQAEARLKDQTRTVRLLGEPEKPGRKHTNGPRMKAITTIEIPVLVHRATRPRKPRDAAGQVLWQIRALRLPEPVLEHKFHPTRKWRFDLAWPDQMLALEIEGVTHEGGRHQRIAGFTEDARKYNAAVLAGWRLLRATPNMIRLGEVGRMLEGVFHEKHTTTHG